jgi:TIR domain
VFYRHRVKAFIHFNFHPFDIDECEGEDMIYDVYLCCAYEDREMARQIVRRLEQDGDREDAGARLLPEGGYCVCYHEKDFMPGSNIMDNIQNAIDCSKRVVCLVSPHFIRSEWCMIEFRGAWDHSVALKKRRLIVMKWSEVDDLLSNQQATSNQPEQDESDIRLYLSTHTYIQYSPDTDSGGWWDQLIYALPRHSLPRSNEANGVLESDEHAFTLNDPLSTRHLLADV